MCASKARRFAANAPCVLGAATTLGAISLMFCPPPIGVTAAAMRFLALLFWGISWWFLGIIDDYIVALIMACGWVILRISTFGQAFAAFGGSNLWLMTSVLAMGVIVDHTGLFRRLGEWVFSFFPASYKGQLFGLTFTGLLLAPFLPNIYGKIVVGGRFAAELGQSTDKLNRRQACFWVAIWAML